MGRALNCGHEGGGGGLAKAPLGLGSAVPREEAKGRQEGTSPTIAFLLASLFFQMLRSLRI